MSNFADLEFKPHPILNGLLARVDFPNGFGASVTIHLPNRHGDCTRWSPGALATAALAEEGGCNVLLRRGDAINYESPIPAAMGRVADQGWMLDLRPEQVTDVLSRIAALPPPG